LSIKHLVIEPPSREKMDLEFVFQVCPNLETLVLLGLAEKVAEVKEKLMGLKFYNYLLGAQKEVEIGDSSLLPWEVQESWCDYYTSKTESKK
jgi:hypothetical protein